MWRKSVGAMTGDPAGTGPGQCASLEAANASGVDASGVLLCVDYVSAPSICWYLSLRCGGCALRST